MTKQQKIARRQTRHDQQVARRLEKKRAQQATMLVTDEEEDDDVQDVDVTEDETDESDTIAPLDDELEELNANGDDSDIEGIPTSHALASDSPEEAQPLKKDMGYGSGMDMAMPMSAPMGPTSFDELDAARAAQEQAQELQETSWDVQDLVRNILNHPMMDAGQKADAIQAVGSQFQDRVDTLLSGGDGEPMKKDMDLLTIEALQAADRRNASALDRMGDWVLSQKAKLSYAAKKAKPDSAYALVTNRGGVKVRKYLIHDKAHVRNALARAAQQIKRGGAGASDAKAALPKIHAAAKRMGIGMSKEKEASAILIQKDAKGDWRWVGWASNNFIDWHGDIISKAAHQEYAAFMKANPDMAPVFLSWHTPGTARKNPVDYAVEDNGFLIMSGKLEEGEAAALLRIQKDVDLGLSIAGFGLRDPKDPRIVTKYRMTEVSDLPLEKAANPFTDFSVIVKEVDMDKKEYLAALLGSPEKAEAFLQKTGMKKEELEAAGVEQKAKDGTPATPPVAPANKPVPTATATTNVPAATQAVIDQVFKEMDIEGLNAFVKQAQEAMEKVPVLESLIKDMQGNQDQKLAEKIAPPASKFVWMTKGRASESKDTEVNDDDELVKRAPGLGENWLSAATGTQPIDATLVER